MIGHLARMSATSMLVVACMLLPFLPGRYDGLAVTLSLMSQVLGTAGLLLVPLGALWLAYELRGRANDTGGRSGTSIGYWLGLASLGASTLIAVAISLVAFVNVGPSLGVAAIALSVWCAARLVARLRAMRSAAARTFNVTPLYLVVVPVVAAISRLALVGPASEFSRNRAIENSAALIRDIERHHEVHGHYPPSLLSLHKDYEPEVMGIEAYHYEPNGEAYNVYFEHVPDLLGTREIVMYNHRGQHEMTSHDMDLLLATPAELARGRGYYAVHDASRPHWKRFLFD
jgi:hypothetical protein